MSTHPRRFAAAAAAGALWLAGCGAAQEPPASPAAKAATEQPMEPYGAAYPGAAPTAGTTAEDPIAELDRAEAEVNGALGRGTGFAQPPSPAPRPTAKEEVSPGSDASA